MHFLNYLKKNTLSRLTYKLILKYLKKSDKKNPKSARTDFEMRVYHNTRNQISISNNNSFIFVNIKICCRNEENESPSLTKLLFPIPALLCFDVINKNCKYKFEKY